MHQDLGLIESMSVGENMAMGYGYPRHFGLIDWRKVDAEAEKALDFLGSPLPLDRPISDLSRAEKSIVAIARALSRKAELLVLDEPTASLPEADVGRLFRIIARLKANNVSVIYVSHRLDEVFRIGDAVTVLRDGRAITVHRPLDISPEQLVKEIVGGTPVTRTHARATVAGAPALVVKDFRVGLFGPVSFEIGAGEIVGLAGLRGQGHEATGRGIAGILPRTSGALTVGGRAREFHKPADAIAAGIGFATGKRGGRGAGADDVGERESLSQSAEFRRHQLRIPQPQRRTQIQRRNTPPLRRAPA